MAWDNGIGQVLAYCLVLETLTRTQVSRRAQGIRTVALELERLISHMRVLAEMADEAGDWLRATNCLKTTKIFMDLMALLCDHHRGRGFLKPGGVRRDVRMGVLNALRQHQQKLVGRNHDFVPDPDLLGRSGVLQVQDARLLGLVGPTARASGLNVDARRDFSKGLPTWSTCLELSGDVLARAQIRWREVHSSIQYCRETLEDLPQGPLLSPATSTVPAYHLAVSLVEGWRGEICHVALTDAVGRFALYKVIDPCTKNWMGLRLALRDQEPAKRALCNKSISLSCCALLPFGQFRE
jgi:Ni,Fe-hydrogenase III large subunit